MKRIKIRINQLEIPFPPKKGEGKIRLMTCFSLIIIGILFFSIQEGRTVQNFGPGTSSFNALKKKHDEKKKEEEEKALPATVTVSSSAVFSTLQRVCETYAERVSTELAPNVLKLFLAWVGLVLAWKFLLIATGKADFVVFFKFFLMLMFVTVFLRDPHYILDLFYYPLKQLTLAITSVVVKGMGSVEGNSIDSVLKHVDTTFNTIYTNCDELMAQSLSDHEWGALLLGWIAKLVFLAISYLFLFYVADLFFGLMALSALSPVFVAMWFFPSTRNYSEGAIRMAVCCCLTVIFAGMSIGICLNLTDASINQTIINFSAGEITVVSPDWKTKAWSLLCIGFLSLLFLRKAAHMAATITGSSDTGTSGLMVGVGMMAAGAARRAMTGGVSAVSGMAGKAFKALGEKAPFKRTPMAVMRDGTEIH